MSKIASMLREIADKEGATFVTSLRLARLSGASISTVQRWGRSHEGSIGPRWTVAYCRGDFTVSEREDYSPRPDPIVPDWFQIPSSMPEIEGRCHHFDIGQRKVLTRQFIQACMDGSIALAPWQCEAVWTEAQQVALLDSMMRGISIGALTMWNPAGDEVIEGLPLPGCKPWAREGWSSKLIVDGQQRATTLVKAAHGDLDHWRWNGAEWTEGRGFLTPRIAVLGALQLGAVEHTTNWGFFIFEHAPRDIGVRMYKDKERIELTDLDIMVLGGSTAQMIETYRRLATHGSPHSPKDLAIMERWASENGVTS